uniref:C2H2-type domain-containing protein n=1 Tax=Strigamia maritima TaxID=126957 RepID=T1JFI3_STRMM
MKKELSVSIVDNDSPRSKINIVWFVCSAENCDYKSYRKFNIDRHFRKMHDQPTKPGRCCDLDFLSKFEYFQHVKTHHANGYYCYVDGCSAWFRKKSTLDRHSIVHTGIKNIHCDSCEYKSPHAHNMKRHCLTRNHQCSNDKVYLSKSLDQIDVHVDSDVDGKNNLIIDEEFLITDNGVEDKVLPVRRKIRVLPNWLNQYRDKDEIDDKIEKENLLDQIDDVDSDRENNLIIDEDIDYYIPVRRKRRVLPNWLKQYRDKDEIEEIDKTDKELEEKIAFLSNLGLNKCRPAPPPAGNRSPIDYKKNYRLSNSMIAVQGKDKIDFVERVEKVKRFRNTKRLRNDMISDVILEKNDFSPPLAHGERLKEMFCPVDSDVPLDLSKKKNSSDFDLDFDEMSLNLYLLY